jgi:hypothetical protein
MKLISLSLFGYNKKYENCFDFYTYLIFFSVGLRAYRVLYPDWTIYLSLETEAYNAYSEYFESLKKLGVKYELKESSTLCRNMLWRIEPIQFADYTICRDIDSLPTYRERQATEVWLKDNTLAHVITDCESHDISIMGGMCSFKKGVVDFCFDRDFSSKGSDQEFLSQRIYPNLKHSITEHRIKGYPSDSKNQYCYDFIENIYVPDVKLSEEQKEQTNSMVNYIGQCSFHIHTAPHILERWKTEGYRENGSGLGAFDFYEEYGDKQFNKELLKIEKKHKNIFFYA